LVKKIQDLLKFFKKKDKTQEWDSITFDTGEGSCSEIHLGPGKVTILPLAQCYEAELPVDIVWEEPKVINTNPPPIEFTVGDIDWNEVLKNLANTYESFLPKTYWVKTLLVSVYHSWDYDSYGVDLSQLEERGLAHFFCTSTKTLEETKEDFPHLEEDDSEQLTTIIHNAVLYDWGDGLWTWEERE
jgi:hypothetical protein